MTAGCDRIIKKIDFENIFKRGKTIAGKLIFFKIIKTNTVKTRTCVVVGSKISKKATVRNKIRRRIKGAMKGICPGLARGFDIAIVAKKEIVDEDYQTIKEEINKLLKTTKVYK